MSIKLLWLKQDLRVHDHPIFAQSEKLSSLLPVYILNPESYAPHMLGFPKMGSHRLQFLLESLHDLSQKLNTLGSRLLFFPGDPLKILPQLARDFRVDEVWTQQEYAFEEQQQIKSLKQKLSVPLYCFESHSLYHPDDIANILEHFPDLFTHFRKEVEKHATVRKPYPVPQKLPPVPDDIMAQPIPELEDLGFTEALPPSQTAIPFSGGEQAALSRMKSYIWDKKALKSYHDTRNQMLGPEYSSKFSLWLANGCLSPRSIYAEVEKFEQEVIKNKSTYWLKFELLWRDFFYFVAQHYGRKIFLRGGIQEKPMHFIDNLDLFDAWRHGHTGQNFVDANMRELFQSGYMSNRGRQNVASFFCHELQLDWRWGASWFESCLIDYDVYSNWGNWMYLAGVGNDTRNRKFNLQKQAERYDPQGEFQRSWLD